MRVRIVTFPETRVATITHRGPAATEHDTVSRLVAWKLEHGLRDAARYRSYGLHYANGHSASLDESRVDFCLSIDRPVEPDSLGIVESTIPAQRCALARDIGSRANNRAVRYLHDVWLPESGEHAADRPVIYHCVNVGPGVSDEEAITDVYLPLTPGRCKVA